jgi:SHS family lactate transporter-like MFS transporter
LISGFLQQGYAVGYLIAAVVNLTLVPHNKHTWRSLYWVGAGLSVFAALFRAVLPESKSFVLAKEQAKMRESNGESSSKLFLREAKAMLRVNWKRAIWAVCLMTGFNFLSHGSQDL